MEEGQLGLDGGQLLVGDESPSALVEVGKLGPEDFGAMEALAMPLSDQDMRDIAAYYAALPPPPAKSGNAEKIAKGQQISSAQYCNSCHGAQLQGQKHIARLAGQSPEYIVTQLKNIRSGSRVDMDGTMGSAARGLSDEDIEAIAAYAASLN